MHGESQSQGPKTSFIGAHEEEGYHQNQCPLCREEVSIRLKLGMFPRSQIDGNVDDDGKTIDVKVKDNVRELRG